MTEAGPAFCSMPKGEALKRIGSVGQPMPPLEVQILDDDGNEVATGEIGEAVLRMEGRQREYYRNRRGHRRGLAATAGSTRAIWPSSTTTATSTSSAARRTSSSGAATTSTPSTSRPSSSTTPSHRGRGDRHPPPGPGRGRGRRVVLAASSHLTRRRPPGFLRRAAGRLQGPPPDRASPTSSPATPPARS